MPRPFTSGGLTSADGGVLTHFHVKRLLALAGRLNEAEPHTAQALRYAAEAMKRLAARNKRLGQKLGTATERRVLEKRGASLSVGCPETPEVIADLAADRPVTVYMGREKKRPLIRVTASDHLPRGVRVIGRFDITSDYREIAKRVNAAVKAHHAEAAA